MTKAGEYENFQELRDNESAGSYKIDSNPKDGEETILVFTPHGGGIEQGTSEITLKTAQGYFSYYLFEAVGNDCGDLHITSINFNEPELLNLLNRHKYAISIHGMTNKIRKEYEADILLGGLNKRLIKITTENLRKNKFSVVNNLEKELGSLKGTDKKNVTNRCLSKEGMQIEISERLRKKFFHGDFKKKRGRRKKTKLFLTFTEIIRNSIT